jgi:hypothetical protein
MPRTLRPLALAAIVGSALTLAVVGLMSMTQVLPAGQHVIVGYGPSPRDMVQIKEGTPYTVPNGKLFLLTGLGTGGDTFGGPWSTSLLVNGQTKEASVLSTYSGSGTFYSSSGIVAMPPGFTATAGTVLEAVGGINGLDARAWGYLADA